MLSDFGIISRRILTVTWKGYQATLPFSNYMFVWEWTFFILVTDWAEADMRIQLSFVKPDIKDICKTVK